MRQYPGAASHTSLWLIDMLSDFTRDRCSSEVRVACGEQLVAVTGSAKRGAFTSSNSGWFHGKCRLLMSAGCHREHQSFANQAAIGV